MRFFGRQFNTRTNHHQSIVAQFEGYLYDYFNANSLAEKGLPTVQDCAEQVNLSANYLSDLLKKETGKTAQEYIHLVLIDKAKTLLINSNLSVKEIAYDLGFEYPHYFSRIFKSKTGQTPIVYRNAN
jgi:AraC-like DNA-binding protein